MSDIFELLVVGSRSIRDYDTIENELNKLIDGKVEPSKLEIVSGGANGVDTLAKRYALKHGYKYKEFPAQWYMYGRSAGYRRNYDMHKYIAEKSEYRACVAFWDGISNGTKHNFELAEQFENPLKIIRIMLGQSALSVDYVPPEIVDVSSNKIPIRYATSSS